MVIRGLGLGHLEVEGGHYPANVTPGVEGDTHAKFEVTGTAGLAAKPQYIYLYIYKQIEKYI